MNHSFRRIILLALLLAVLGTLVIGVPAGAQDTPAVDVGVTLNTDVSGDVEFWHFWGSPVRRNAIRRVVALCEQALPNINVEEVFKPFGEIWTANTAAVAAGSGMPDVIVSDRGQLPREAADGIYMSLQELIDRDGIAAERFYPFTWEQAQFDGQVYGIPFETDVRVLFYNKSLFEAAGLDPNDPPDTWEEVAAADEALRIINENGEIERIGFYPLEGPGIDIWALTNGVQWVDETGAVNVNQPGTVETYEWILGFIEDYGGFDNIQEFRATFGPPPNDGFMSGRVAMKVDIAGYMSQLNFYRPRISVAEGQDPIEFQWGIAPMPYNTTQTSWSGGFTVSIPNGAEDPEAAWEFIKCMTSPAGQASWARDTYATPSDIAAVNDPILLSDPNWAFIAEAMNTSSTSTFVPAYPNYFEQVNQRNEAIWRGEIDPATALEEAQAAIDETIGAGQ